jgi:hypothetical protein
MVTQLTMVTILSNLESLPKMFGSSARSIASEKASPMTLRGFVMSADLEENPPGSDQIELWLRLQGVGPGQPRRIVVPYSYLLTDDTIDTDDVAGRAFEADVEEVEPKRWEVQRLVLVGKVLRSSDD